VNGYGAYASFVLSQMKTQITVTTAPFPEVQKRTTERKTQKSSSLIDMK